MYRASISNSGPDPRRAKCRSTPSTGGEVIRASSNRSGRASERYSTIVLIEARTAKPDPLRTSDEPHQLLPMPDALSTIVIYEPLCSGSEHAKFNAALLSTVLAAYPKDRVEFLATTDHMRHVREVLEPHCSDGARITWRTVQIAPRHGSTWRRLPRELRLCQSVMRRASRLDTRCVINTALTESSLLATKLVLAIRRLPFPTVAIPHSVLASIRLPVPRQPWNRIVALRCLMETWHPHRLKYVALIWNDALSSTHCAVGGHSTGKRQLADISARPPSDIRLVAPGSVRGPRRRRTIEGASTTSHADIRWLPRSPAAEHT